VIRGIVGAGCRGCASAKWVLVEIVVSGRFLRASLALGITLGLCVLVGSGSTLAASQRPDAAAGQVSLSAVRNPVVPLGGTVAGKGYAYWMERVNVSFFFVDRLPLTPCATLSVGGVRVAILTNVLAGGEETASRTCSEPAGRAIYSAETSTECSTLMGDHRGFGTTPADLQNCARAEYDKGTSEGSWSLVLDGRSIDVRKLVVATGEFYVPKVVAGAVDCEFVSGGCPAASSAHAAAYGAGLLLSGLPKGTHVLYSHGNGAFEQHWWFTVTIHVR
jgi:hypothetical protein